MSDYRTKSVAVKAEQFHRDAKPWPSRVRLHAWNVGPGDTEEDLPSVEVGRWPRSGWELLRDGDWIVTWSGGSAEVFSEPAFADKFEPDERAPGQTKGPR